MPSTSPKVLIVGGGAAGFFGAITCAEAMGNQAQIRILEKGAQVLHKVRISGGGRCNVTHACFEPRPLATHYPRGERTLIGPFHRWQPEDTVAWFENRGVPLKVEADGRVFPTSDDSQTILRCLQDAATAAGVIVSRKTEVARIDTPSDNHFEVHTSAGERIAADAVLIATGGIRSAAARHPVQSVGHDLTPATPSLFTFHIEDARLTDLQGLSVNPVSIHEPASRLSASGPLLVTHWGLSGPAVLKLSALGARTFAEKDYSFSIDINWLPDQKEETIRDALGTQREHARKRTVHSWSPFNTIPRRLWSRLVDNIGVPDKTIWSHLARPHLNQLVSSLTRSTFHVSGKSLNKDEFVTCGGVHLKDVSFKTLESKHVPGLYFAGEVLDVDGLTGGFNFQSAWTTAYIAGQSIAARFQ